MENIIVKTIMGFFTIVVSFAVIVFSIVGIINLLVGISSLIKKHEEKVFSLLSVLFLLFLLIFGSYYVGNFLYSTLGVK